MNKYKQIPTHPVDAQNHELLFAMHTNNAIHKSPYYQYNGLVTVHNSQATDYPICSSACSVL